MSPHPPRESLLEETREKTGQDIFYFLSHKGTCGIIRHLELKLDMGQFKILENIGFCLLLITDNIVKSSCQK